jgi:hypothetical protein
MADRVMQTDMPTPSHSSKTLWILVFLTAVLFFLAAFVFIPTLGIQNDEAIFATVAYGPIAREFRLRAFQHDVPLMIMTYLGAFKTWVFAGIFAIVRPSIWSLRLPPAIIGGVTVAVFAFLLQKTSKLRFAALIGAVLLATDPSYFLTTVFDWGPVAFQHLLLVSGILFVYHFIHSPVAPRSTEPETESIRSPWRRRVPVPLRSKRDIFLSLGFLCLGLGLWDKALLSWSLIGLALAVLLVFPKDLWRVLTPRAAAIATVSFLLGATPLVLYNARSGLKTFRGNAKIAWSEVAPKWVQVKSTLDGSALFGYLVREEWEPLSVAPSPGTPADWSLALRNRAGEQRQTWGYAAFFLAAAAIPLWWTRRRAVLFGLIYLAVAWLLMAATHDAGGSAHHVVLLWPFPQFILAIVLGCLAERFGKAGLLLAGLATGLLAAQNLLVLNQYYTQATRFCGGTVWTDAMEPLHRRLIRQNAKAINITGWGMEFTLTMLEKGKLPLRYVADHVAQETPGVDDRNAIQAILAEENGVFIGHTAELEIQPGIGARWAAIAAQLGYRKEMIEITKDRCGRPTFEVYRFLKD